MSRSIFKNDGYNSQIRCQTGQAPYTAFASATSGAPVRVMSLNENSHQIVLKNTTDADVTVRLTAPGKDFEKDQPWATLVVVVANSTFSFDGDGPRDLVFPASSVFHVFPATTPTTGAFLIFSSGV